MTKVPSLVRIDQVVHGYDRGHRELATSRPLEEEARSTLASLSDLLTARPLRDGESYLAIYPLKSASAHIVAATWPAGEGYRPGSVWTHSLLVSYEAMAQLPDLMILQDLLRRPAIDDLSSYHEPILVDPKMKSSLGNEDPRAQTALYQLYGTLEEQIEVKDAGTTAANAQIAVAIWSQMWPALRREFSALTLASDSRHPLPGKLSLRFLGEASHDGIPMGWRTTQGLQELSDDLRRRGPTELRSFLARYAVEAENPRRMALPLAWYFAHQEVPARQIIRQLRETLVGERLPRLTRDLVLADFAKASRSERFVELAKDTRDEQFAFDIAPIVDQAISLDENALSTLLPAIAGSKHATLGAGLFDALVDHVPADQLAVITPMKVKQTLLKRRGELAVLKAFWPKADAKRAKLLEQVAETELTWTDAQQLFGKDIGPKTALALIERSEPLCTSTLVSMLSHPAKAMQEALIEWLFDEPARLSQIKRVARQINEATLKRIAYHQIEVQTPFDAKTWASILGEFGGKRRARELSIVGGAAALCCARHEDFALAKSDALTLLALCRSDRLSSGQAQFLDRVLPRTYYRAAIDDRIIEQLLRKWNKPASVIEILEGAEDASTREKIIRATARIRGRPAVMKLSEQRGQSKTIHRQIETYIEKTKPISFPFGWLFD